MGTFLSSADIEALTRGRVDNRMLQNWRLKQEWLAPTPPAVSTYPYEYTFEHAAEAAIIAEYDTIGVAQKLARQIIKRRLVGHATGTKDIAVFEGDAGEAILSLPEFQKKGNWFWVAFLGSHGRGQAPYVVSVGRVEGKTGIAAALAGAGVNAAAAIILDISQIVQRVRDFMSHAQSGSNVDDGR